MKDVDYVISQVALQLTNNGTRLTTKRKLVFSCLLASEKAMSAYEIVSYAKDHFGEVLPVMSVYRILDFLQEHNVAHKLQLANKYVACSHICCDHSHQVPQFLVCSQCAKVREVGLQSSIINDLERGVKEAGFYLQSPQIELNCLCDECGES
jgi:Fur family zinc uptake transcriptional regulator